MIFPFSGQRLRKDGVDGAFRQAPVVAFHFPILNVVAYSRTHREGPETRGGALVSNHGKGECASTSERGTRTIAPKIRRRKSPNGNRSRKTGGHHARQFGDYTLDRISREDRGTCVSVSMEE